MNRAVAYCTVNSLIKGTALRYLCSGPVEADCEWSEWSGWSLCSISCGTGGERRRYVRRTSMLKGHAEDYVETHKKETNKEKFVRETVTQIEFENNG